MEEKISWRSAVLQAMRRRIVRTGSFVVTCQDLINHELQQIVRETGSKGKTPDRTLHRTLQELRDEGKVEFLTPGIYHLLDPPSDNPR